MIGQKVLQYKILEKLGEGGMGEVYLAEDTELDRKVALKFLPPHYTLDKELRSRFRHEAKAAAALNHPNIITVHQIGEHENRTYIAMEYVEGESLREKVNRGPFSADGAIDVTLQICEGLNAAHQAGIIHRDIKPENIVIDKAGRVRILDFGLARMSGATKLTKEASTLGTISYMSPEQFQGKPVDHRADIWAVGVLLYEMLTGVQPFQGEYEQAVMYSVCNEEPEPVTALSPAVPQELEAILHKTLAKDTDGRYQQAEDLRGELKRVLRTLAHPDDPGRASATNVPRPANMTRSRWSSVGLISLGVVVLIVLTTVVSRFVGNNSDAPEMPVRIKQLTSFLGCTYAPSWNPDGSMFAYGHTGGGDMNIYVMSEGGEPYQLTDNPSDELAPRWSPTGDKIAFVSDRGNGTEVFWIAPTGGREHRLTNTFIPPPERQTAWFRGLGTVPWSSDGKELLFHRMQENGAIAIWKINIVSRQETQLTFPEPDIRDMSASWSPDGKWIAFDRNQGGSRAIWLMSAKGGEARPFIEDEYFNFAPAWTPDGLKMLFLSMGQALIANIREYDLGSETLRPLTNQTSAILAYSISTKGDIAYSGNGHQTDLYLGRVGELSNAHQNLTHNTLNNLGARFSPDGKTILYHSDRGGNYDVWMYSRETGEHLQLTDHPGIDVVPDWSPKGDILFVSNRGGKFQLWVIDDAENDPRLLSNVEIPLHQGLPVIHRNGPRWSPDASMIGYTAAGDSSETLWLIDVSSGNARKTHLEGALSFDWYLNSERVIYVKKTSKGSMKKELRAANLRTGEDILLLSGACSEPAVNPVGDAVAYLHAESVYEKNIFVLPLKPPKTEEGLPITVGDPEQLTDGQGVWHTYGFSWAPDGTTFVYTRDTDFGDIYAIEKL